MKNPEIERLEKEVDRLIGENLKKANYLHTCSLERTKLWTENSSLKQELEKSEDLVETLRAALRDAGVVEK